MIFKINTKTLNSVKSYPKSCLEIIFCNSNDDFLKILNSRNLEINDLQKNSFLDDKNPELKIWRLDSPGLVILKRVDLNENFNVDFFRNYLSGIVKKLKKKNFTNLIINLPIYDKYRKFFSDKEYFYQTMGEGIFLGNYDFSIYKSEKSKVKKLNVVFTNPDKDLIDSAIKKAQQVINGVVFARDLVNEPANVLTPHEYGARIRKEFKDPSVSVKIFNEKQLAKMKMNAILSVGKASENKPRLIIAHYKPAKKIIKKIALVGKGVTYDTGGLSIKTTAGMLEMKADMAGSAVVFGIIKSAEMLKLPLEIIGIVPAVENAISGDAYKPGDIISTSSGKTIEVKDTDAEGRIVLADALEYASKLKPDEIIDFATLTGAVAVALGLFTAGIFTKNDEMSKNIIYASNETYEHAWRMPFWDEFNKLLESKIADVSNLGPRWGGAITAGKFLEHFVDKNIPWLHMDLAGPALKHDLTNYTKDYCTGYGVRLVLRYFDNLLK